MPTNYQYRLADYADQQIILSFLLKYFAKDEPCISAMKLSPKETEFLLNDIVERCLRDPFSTVVTTESGDVAGVMLNSVWRRDDKGDDKDFKSGDRSENLTIFIQTINRLHANLWNLVPKNVNAVLHREVSSVGTPFQRQGIASRLVTENITPAKIKEFEIGGVVSETTSFANQTLLAKRGFKCLYEIPHSEITKSNGHQLFKTADGSKGLQLNFKPIAEFDHLMENNNH